MEELLRKLNLREEGYICLRNGVPVTRREVHCGTQRQDKSHIYRRRTLHKQHLEAGEEDCYRYVQVLNSPTVHYWSALSGYYRTKHMTFLMAWKGFSHNLLCYSTREQALWELALQKID